MKTIIGYFAIVLGAVGFLVTVAIIGGAWWGASQVKARSQQVTAQADKSLVEAEDGIERLRKQIASNAESVEGVRAAAEKASGDRPNTGLTRTENEKLRNRLRPLTERADAISEAIPPFAQAVENLANLSEQAGSKSRGGRLRAASGKMREAGKELDAVRKDAGAMAQNEATPTAREVATLAENTHKPLDRLSIALGELKKESEAVRKDLPEVREDVDEWTVLGPAILTGILLWVALGQLAIIAWGRRRLAPPPVAPPPPTIRR